MTQSTSLVMAMYRFLLDSLSHPSGDHLLATSQDPTQATTAPIIGLANDIQAILGEAKETATTMFPHKSTSAPARVTLPRHLWLKSLRNHIFNIRRRAKASRRLIKVEAMSLEDTQEDPPLPSGYSAIHVDQR